MQHRIRTTILTLIISCIATASFAQSDILKRLPAPPRTAKRGKATFLAKTRLVLVSKKANDITDDADWFVRNGVSLPEYRVPGTTLADNSDDWPRGIASEFENGVIRRALKTASAGTNRALCTYGEDNTRSRYLVCVDTREGENYYAFDFSNYRSPTGGAEPYLLQSITYALEDKSGMLFVANGINGYAKEAKNQTGYVTAIDPKTGALRWRSEPLTQNASTFTEAGDVLICGYGFTAEPDFLYLLDKKSGRRVQTIPLKSGPSYILRKGDRVYVRCYDTDYVFAIKR